MIWLSLVLFAAALLCRIALRYIDANDGIDARALAALRSRRITTAGPDKHRVPSSAAGQVGRVRASEPVVGLHSRRHTGSSG